MSATMSTSADTIRSLHGPPRLASPTPSSPPDSPSLSASGSSVSSFPSVSSSFFFSSAAASPPHEPVPHPVEETLIIPSLTLPAPLLRRKEARGPVTRLLVLGSADIATAALCVDSPDADAWVDEDGFRVLRMETGWRDPSGDGAESDSASRCNIELVALGEDIHQFDVHATANRILTPFRRIAALLAPPLLSSAHEEEELLTALLAGPEVPLYTALLVVPPSFSSNTASTSASVSNSAPPLADIAIDAIPESLRRLVPVICLVPEPAPPPPPNPPPSREDADANAVEGEDPNDSVDTIPPLDLDLDLDLDTAPAPSSALDGPPTARPPHQAYLHPGTDDEPPTLPPQTGTQHNAYTPSALRHALRLSYSPPPSAPAPGARDLRTAAAVCFVRWWRAGGGDPYARAASPRHRHSFLIPSQSPFQSFQSQVESRSQSRQIECQSQAHSPPHPRLVAHLPPHQRQLTEKPYPLSTTIPTTATMPPLMTTTSTPALRLLKTDLHDPLHLPSIFALVRDVVKAWSFSPTFAASGASPRDERGYDTEKRWWRVGLGAAFRARRGGTGRGGFGEEGGRRWGGWGREGTDGEGEGKGRKDADEAIRRRVLVAPSRHAPCPPPVVADHSRRLCQRAAPSIAAYRTLGMGRSIDVCSRLRGRRGVGEVGEELEEVGEELEGGDAESPRDDGWDGRGRSVERHVDVCRLFSEPRFSVRFYPGLGVGVPAISDSIYIDTRLSPLDLTCFFRSPSRVFTVPSPRFNPRRTAMYHTPASIASPHSLLTHACRFEGQGWRPSSCSSVSVNSHL
ncbi:hypothetical protein C8R45DRAFT_1104313 [Mycena sanguinolenta]|nr:hypothetical protein C8R45DRAFT_1104313 [Mycena sanguinolenta]